METISVKRETIAEGQDSTRQVRRWNLLVWCSCADGLACASISMVILEVLSRVRGTAEACEALAITPMRYYILETRARIGGSRWHFTSGKGASVN